MATARFEVCFIKETAKRVIAVQEVQRAAAKEEAINRLLTTPVTEGKWWWKRQVWRACAQAEDWYTVPYGWAGSLRYRTEMSFNRKINAAKPILDLACASDAARTDGYITLDDEEIAALGLHKEQA